MIAELSVHTLDSVHQSDAVATVKKILQKYDLEFRVGPMATTISGDALDVLAAVHECTQQLLEGHPGYTMTMQLEDRVEEAERSVKPKRVVNDHASM